MDMDQRDIDQITVAQAEIDRLKRRIVTIKARMRQRKHRKAKT